MSFRPFRVIGFTGDREFRREYVTELAHIFHELHEHEVVTPIVHVGDCPTGVDCLVKYFALVADITVKEFKADWSLGKRAGPIRNQEIVDSELDILYALHIDIEKSRGTKDCARRGLKAGLDVRFPLSSL